MKLEKRIQKRKEQWVYKKGKQVGKGKSEKAVQQDNTRRN
jgi:hypothetical protein